MPAPELRIGNQVAYFRKSVRSPDFKSESVLTQDAFQFARLWLSRNCKEALPFWEQAEAYYKASKQLPVQSAPLTSYYCFLNAAKALLVVKSISFTDRHGVSGDYNPESKRAISNEVIKIQRSGILSALSKYLGETDQSSEHNLSDLLANLPFIHRAYRHTYKSKKELFIPLKNVVYRKHPNQNYVWMTGEVFGRYADGRTLKTLPSNFEVDEGYKDKCVIRTKKRIKWHARGDDSQNIEAACQRLYNLHQKSRMYLSCISAPISLWYLKRNISGINTVQRYNMTIIMAVMHRLSELSRYDPKGLNSYLDGQVNWLLTEFIELSPHQFIDELVCEMTGLELRMPGVRP